MCECLECGQCLDSTNTCTNKECRKGPPKPCAHPKDSRNNCTDPKCPNYIQDPKRGPSKTTAPTVTTPQPRTTPATTRTAQLTTPCSMRNPAKTVTIQLTGQYSPTSAPFQKGSQRQGLQRPSRMDGQGQAALPGRGSHTYRKGAPGLDSRPVPKSQRSLARQ